MLTEYPQIRLTVYLVGLALTAAGSGVAAYVAGGGLGGAILAAAGVLTGASLATAAANTPRGVPMGGRSPAPLKIDGDTWGDGTPVDTTPVVGPPPVGA